MSHRADTCHRDWALPSRRTWSWCDHGTRQLSNRKHSSANLSPSFWVFATITSVQSSLANGRIANLSTLAPVNELVRSWPHLLHDSLNPHESAPQMASRSVHPIPHSSPMCPNSRLVTLHGCECIRPTLNPHLIYGSLNPQKSAPKCILISHTTCDICSNRPNLMHEHNHIDKLLHLFYQLSSSS